MSTLLEAALDYARQGRAVFPLIAYRKEPATRRGFHDATTNPATIRRWWTARADYNIGIRTGAASGIWIFDIDIDDDKDGEASLRDLEVEHGKLPATMQSITAHGRHAWFAYTCPIPSTCSRIGPGLDVRGDGGYIVAPPSIHPSGRPYAWSTDSAAAAATAPAWLIRLAQQRPEAKPYGFRGPNHNQFKTKPYDSNRPNPARPGAYGRVALEREIAALAATAPGSRNHTLNRAAFSLFQLVAGGELDQRDVIAGLCRAAEVNGLARDDGWHTIWATIRSGACAGAQHPRRANGGAP
jgi:hypothetical protein